LEEKIKIKIKFFGLVVTGPLESYAVADAHDGVINGIRMAGHVKTCRGWDQLFKDGNLHMVQRIQCYSTASLKIFQFIDGYVGPTIPCRVWI